MAITINQEPTGPVYSVNNLVYNLTSNNINETAFRFVVDLYETGSTTRLDRREKFPNPNGRGVFDLSRVIDDQLTYDLSALGATNDIVGVDSSKSFTLQFGERYISSTGVAILDSDLEASRALEVIKGVKEFGTGTSDISNSVNTQLSNTAVRTRIHRNDSMFISRYDTSTSSVIHANVTLPLTGDTHVINIEGVVYTFDIYDTKSVYGEDRFAWFNRTGGIDFYTFDQIETLNTSVDKPTFNQVNINFTGATSTDRIDGNPRAFRGGTQNYNTTLEETYVKQSSWIQADQGWVSGIFESPEVWRQMDNNTWRKVNVMNSDYATHQREATTTNRNYTLMWRYANDKRNL